MDIKTELKEAIDKFIKKGTYQELKDTNNLATALLPIFAKYAVSLVEVDETKVRGIMKDYFGYKDIDYPAFNFLKGDLVKLLATSQIIKGKE